MRRPLFTCPVCFGDEATHFEGHCPTPEPPAKERNQDDDGPPAPPTEQPKTPSTGADTGDGGAA